MRCADGLASKANQCLERLDGCIRSCPRRAFPRSIVPALCRQAAAALATYGVGIRTKIVNMACGMSAPLGT